MLKAGRTEEELKDKFKELDQIKIDRGTEHLVMMFDALSSARASGMGGPLAISHIEIKAYCDLMDEQLTPWEVSALRAMDNAYLEESYNLSEG